MFIEIGGKILNGGKVGDMYGSIFSFPQHQRLLSLADAIKHR